LQIRLALLRDVCRMRVQIAGIAQLVEHDLAKVGVASSNLVSRSKYKKKHSFTVLFWF
jgi:hypothetical protein